MATMPEAAAVASARWPGRRRSRRLADDAIRAAVARAGVTASDVELLLNAGLYRERILGEPALAALIQADVDANPGDPHAGGHGTFSFDVANGACGALTALHIADGFLRAGTVRRALVVASDAGPGHAWNRRFPFPASGAAVVCRWSQEPAGLVGFRWATAPEEGHLLRARVGFERGRNRLRIEEDPGFGERAAAWAGKVAASLLADHGLAPDADLPGGASGVPGHGRRPAGQRSRGRPGAHGRAAGRARHRPGAGSPRRRPAGAAGLGRRRA